MKYGLPRKSIYLLRLLGTGVSVCMENLWELRGLPSEGYIEPFVFDGEKYQSLGLWDMSPTGLQNALSDIKHELNYLLR